jgi:hypothetical protein
MNTPDIEEGIDILESMWYLIAVSIVEMAITAYKLDEGQAEALKDLYLKANNYYVTLKT